MRHAIVAFFLLGAAGGATQAQAIDPACAVRFGSKSRDYARCIEERNRPVPSAPKPSRWTINESIDRLDDVKSTSVAAEAAKVAIWNSKNAGRDRAYLVLSCVGQAFVASLEFETADGMKVRRGQSPPRAAYRFDRNQPVRGGWSLIGEDGDMRIAHHDEAIEFARILRDVKTLFMRIENDAGVVAEIDFNVDGFESASEPVRAACPWKWRQQSGGS